MRFYVHFHGVSGCMGDLPVTALQFWIIRVLYTREGQMALWLAREQ